MRILMHALVLAGGLFVASQASGKIIDTFTINDGTGTANAQLDGTPTEVGGVNWIARPSIQFGPTGDIRRVGGGSDVAVVPFSPGKQPAVYLAAHVTVADSGNADAFFGLGFAQDTSLQAFWNADPSGAELWLHVAPSGRYEAFAQDTKILLARGGTGTAPGHVAGQPDFLELFYDTVGNRVTAKINGTTIVNNVFLGSFVPSVNAAGFFMYANNTVVHDFIVAAPEPASIGLLGLGALMLGRRRR
jgi:hypothetical protein